MYTLYHGDCLDWFSNIPDQSIDAIITDPPYNTTKCVWDKQIDFEAMWKELKRIIKPTRPIVLFGSQPFTSQLIVSNLEWFKYTWVWNKKYAGVFASASKRPLKIHEDIIVFSSGNIPYFPQMTPREKAISSGKRANPRMSNGKEIYTTLKRIYTHKYPTSILDVPRSLGKRKIHPTEKPIRLLEYLINTYTEVGETILDFCFGSGSTGVACANTNRKFIGVEKYPILEKPISKNNPNYYFDGKNRIETAYQGVVL